MITVRDIFLNFIVKLYAYTKNLYSVQCWTSATRATIQHLKKKVDSDIMGYHREIDLKNG